MGCTSSQSAVNNNSNDKKNEIYAPKPTADLKKAESDNSSNVNENDKSKSETVVSLPKEVISSPDTAALTNSKPKSSAPEGVNFKPIHSAIRWKKTRGEVESLITSAEAANCKDTGNGNCPLHIAAQNGHLEYVELLIEKLADVNCQNNKGNTPLHMALSYDYVDVANALINAGANQDLVNAAGHPARKGLDGDKCLPVVMLGVAKTTANAMAALMMCEENQRDLDKGSFVNTGLKVKKEIGDEWTNEVNNKFKQVLELI